VLLIKEAAAALQLNPYSEIAKIVGRDVSMTNRPVVCVQGLGFVGAPMAIAIATARDNDGLPCFSVIGVDLPSAAGLRKIDAINGGTLPLETSDRKLLTALKEAHAVGNLIATADPAAYALASVIVVDVHFDVMFANGKPALGIDNFCSAIRTVAEVMRPDCLMIVETTVPPGTCERVVARELKKAMSNRNLSEDSFLLAHSYERMMPGEQYLDSIINCWRVYSGYTPPAADACEAFLSKVVNVKEYPLTRLSSTTASETGKVLENTYRAATIAFMEEWGRFAESVGIDLFEVIEAIRRRPTHSNIRHPGFGVGGYCLTKDPFLASLAAHELFGLEGIEFPFSEMALATNRVMPLVSLDKIEQMLGGNLSGKSLLVLGVSYREGVGDTRYSPSQLFVESARARGAKVISHDPFVHYWSELKESLPFELPSPEGFDAVIFAVPHKQYTCMDVGVWLKKSAAAILDANNVLSQEQRSALVTEGRKVVSIGRGGAQ
jgi:UDP-N-acetyl-D-glucosamine dehydrogenase